MYQSLHTTVIGPGRERIEIQIRTHEMHRVAERGIAAHWKYKEKGGGGIADGDAARFGWLRQLVEWQKDLKDPAEFLEGVKVDLFQDEVYVFTPKGDVRVFPRGATPVDFAFAIHSQLGEKITGARVNGKLEPLRYKLKSGDIIDVVSSPNQQPSKDWLDFVGTTRARARIRNFLRAEQRDKSLRLGRELLEREFQKGHISLSKLLKNTTELRKVLESFRVASEEELLIGIGYGKIDPVDILHSVAPPSADGVPSSPPEQLREGKLAGFVRKITPNVATRSPATTSSGSSRAVAASPSTAEVAPRPSTPIPSAVSRSSGTPRPRSTAPCSSRWSPPTARASWPPLATPSATSASTSARPTVALAMTAARSTSSPLWPRT
jgi:GTP pyrophosphokinase